MSTSFKTDSKKSRNWFNRFVVPALRDFGFTDVVSVEKHDSELESMLDFAGIDALAKDTSGATVSFASRVIQKKPNYGDYDCFSLRQSRRNGYTTEIEKLRLAIQADSLRPMWHCQSFISEDGKTATCGLIRTKELVRFVDNHETRTKPTNDGTKFIIVDWKDLSNCKIPFWTKKIAYKAPLNG